jgi:hypothetical protein
VLLEDAEPPVMGSHEIDTKRRSGRITDELLGRPDLSGRQILAGQILADRSLLRLVPSTPSWRASAPRSLSTATDSCRDRFLPGLVHQRMRCIHDTDRDTRKQAIRGRVRMMAGRDRLRTANGQQLSSGSRN